MGAVLRQSIDDRAAVRPAHTPRVSVGMPVYNGERYLRLALDSILAQTFTDFELLISDNASTDATQAICEEYRARDARIRYYRYAENRGASWNFANVFHLARGAYFKWQCYDDLMAPQMLAQAVAALDADPALILAYHRATIIDAHGAPVQLWADNIAVPDPRPHVRVRQALYGRNKGWLESQFGLMRREVLAQTNLIGPQPHSDQILMLELALRGCFRELPEHLFLRREHPGNSTADYDTRKIAAFLDPSRKHSVKLDRLERLGAYASAVTRAPIPIAAKLRCYGELRGLVLKGGLRHAANDLFEAARTIVHTRLRRAPAPPLDSTRDEGVF